MKFPPDRNRYAFQGHLALSQRRVFAVSACLRGCAGLKGLAMLASGPATRYGGAEGPRRAARF